jgi:glycosyltransferase involved in cell wall biosynthesis
MTNFNYLRINKSRKIRYLNHKQKNTTYIVFLHGFMSNLEGKKPKTFLNFAKRNKMGFLALEYSGHGKSSGKFTDGNISKWTKETTQIIKKIVKKELVRLTEQYRLTNQIKFIKHCKDMALAYKVSDIIISASIEPEAFGRVAVEAQSMEKLIIASNIGGSNETIIDEKTGFLFESGDAHSLSKKIIKAITMDETSLNLIGKEGRKNIIKKFNVEKMCFSTYSEYKRLLN